MPSPRAAAGTWLSFFISFLVLDRAGVLVESPIHRVLKTIWFKVRWAAPPGSLSQKSERPSADSELIARTMLWTAAPSFSLAR
ncbi:hypothetical protein LX36DRAFT_653047 [Colletotrichum falcatum]|nr:hypothetical protein LX36DRAFT_653047 [Colletotrichum falcatum]